MSYKDAGVDIDAGNELVERIKPLVKSTHRSGVLGGVGGFGGLFELPTGQYRQPVLVSGADGVGTKLKLALQAQQFDGIGIDLVAMCVNDIVVSGAEPLFFLDYYATAKLDVDVAAAVVSSIAAGCRQSGCALSGGETAEMPGLYQPGDFDLAGFAVGIVEKSAILDGSTIDAGDSIIGLPSSGLHSNGFSMVNHLLTRAAASGADASAKPTNAELLEPTTLYVKPALKACATGTVKGLAHITGGGITENLPRVFPRDKNLQAQIDTGCWQRAGVFQWIKQQGNVAPAEMYRTFNCGIGMAVIAASADTSALISLFQSEGLDAVQIGTIETAPADSASTNPVVLSGLDAF